MENIQNVLRILYLWEDYRSKPTLWKKRIRIQALSKTKFDQNNRIRLFKSLAWNQSWYFQKFDWKNKCREREREVRRPENPTSNSIQTDKLNHREEIDTIYTICSSQSSEPDYLSQIRAQLDRIWRWHYRKKNGSGWKKNRLRIGPSKKKHETRSDLIVCCIHIYVF